MARGLWTWGVKVACLLITAGLVELGGVGPSAAGPVASWESAIAALRTPRVSGYTVRQFARITVGGAQLRLRISNETGTQPLVVENVHVARPGAAPGSIDPSTDRAVTFGGAHAIVVAAGSVVLSDEIAMPLAPLTRVAVSALYTSASRVQVGHLLASETNYIAPGDHASEAVMTGATATPSGFYLSGLSTFTPFVQGGSVACLGDSITDGLYSTPGSEHRYPDRLAERLLAASQGRIGAIDAGIVGNGLLSSDPTSLGGPGGLDRLQRDVLGRASVRWLILFEGINDIIAPPDAGDTAAELISVYQQIIAQAHEAGVKVFGATLTPYAGSGPLYYSPAKDAIRQRVNAWIRTSGAFDAVFDFDAVVRAPNDPTRLKPIYDGGDHLHLSDAGYAAIANSIPLGVILNGGS